MHTILGDVRYAVRQLAKHRGFTLTALVTLGLGIGCTTVFFSILDAVALRPLPYADADRLVAVQGRQQGPGGGQTGISYPDFRELAGGEVFAGAAAYATEMRDLEGGAAPERVDVAAVSAGLFPLLGQRPALGRGFLDAEDRPGGDRVVVLGHETWVRDFGGSSAVLGRAVRLNGESYTVVGVAPERFDFPDGAEVWVPLAAGAAADRDDRGLGMVARLGPGVSLERARGWLAARSEAVAEAYPDSNTGWAAAALPLRETMGQKHRAAATALMTAALLVLLIACGNLAGLHLVLVSARRHELALRAALGASRARLVRLIVTEGLVLGLLGGVLGVAVARVGLTAFVAGLGKPAGVAWLEFTLDYRVLLFALAVAVATGLVTSLSSVLRGSRVELRGTLQEGGRAAGPGRGGQRLRRGLVAVQIALSFAFVAGAAAVVLSATRQDLVDPGFDRDGLLALRVSLDGPGYDAPESRVALVEQALARLRSIPGVRDAAVVSHAPLIDRNGIPWTGVQREAQEAAGGTASSLRFVDAGYPSVMGIPVVRGRSFTAAEARDPRSGVVVINRTLAQRLWPAGDALGGRLRLAADGDPARWYTVVGVVGDVMQRAVPARPEGQVYLPFSRARQLSLVLRATADPASVIPAARAVLRAADPALPLYEVRTMREAYDWLYRDRLSQGLVLGSLGAIALLLAALGVYGVMAFAVSQRTRELGIRVALGGRRADVLGLVLRQGIRVVGAGLGAGLLLALAATRGLSALFVGIPAFEPWVLAGVTAVLAGVAVLACVVPARRATRVDPVVALRAE